MGPGKAGKHHEDSIAELLMRLDKATETLELMEELGVTTRDDLLALMDDLERQIDDMDTH